MTATQKLPEPMMPMTRDNPTGNWATELAFEVALGYFSPEDLQERFQLDERLYERVLQNADFRRAVQSYRKEIDDEGIAFRLRAKKQASLVLEELATIAFDQLIEAKDRLKAMEMLCKYAGFEMSSSKDEGGTKIVINTNLALNGGTSDKGVYTIAVPSTGAGGEEDRS